MTKFTKTQYEPVDASPVKSFFVHMLTRDIKLEEAMLDLLDNCVDGILRSRGRANGAAQPYAGRWAEIEFKKDSFTISDNCGGIPWSLHDYAFRTGRAADRPPDAPRTVGVYGIGMKRAIFKMGSQCLISTQNAGQGYELEITPEWTGDEKNWKIPVRAAGRSMPEDGTTIYIGDLHPGIAKVFSEDAEAFKSDFERMVETHYAFIIKKGFRITINGDRVRPRPTKLVFREARGAKKHGVQPFIFKTRRADGVEVFLAVGFTRPIPSEDEIAAEQQEKKYSSLDAGWTVLCNDRAVLYCDRTELTGWGEAGVPRYHTQFTAISGIVEFRADDASLLPTTTTKRGIDASSALYLQVKNKMREGMAIFTDYTNKWKGRADEAREHIEAGGPPIAFEEIKTRARLLSFAPTTKGAITGEQYKPVLPLPKKPESQSRRISFVKDVTEVRAVSEHLFSEPDKEPSVVGEACFDLMLKEARK